MINKRKFLFLFNDWYIQNKLTCSQKQEDDFYKHIIVNTMPICCDDIYEDDEIVVTNVLKGYYLTSLESLTGELEKFEWIEIKLGFKDKNANIVQCKTIGYEI